MAGGGSNDEPGDGGPADRAFIRPQGMTLDGTDNIFLADFDNSSVRRIDSRTGTITTIAGTGSFTSFNDGGPATNAVLKFPAAVVFNADGELFIADTQNQRIRKVDGGGTITTLAGGGLPAVLDGSLATEVVLGTISSLAFDSAGNLFLADTDCHCVFRIDSQTWILSRVVGTGESGFSGDGGRAREAALNNPGDIYFDSEDSLYIADSRNHRIRRVDAISGYITTVAGCCDEPQDDLGDGGKAKDASLNRPLSVVLDSEGNLYIGDFDNFRIRKVDLDGNITTVAGNGRDGAGGDGGDALQARIRPNDLAFNLSGNLLVADLFGVRKINLESRIITRIAGRETEGPLGDGGPALQASLFAPGGIAIDSNGNLFIADTFSDRVRAVRGTF